MLTRSSHSYHSRPESLEKNGIKYIWATNVSNRNDDIFPGSITDLGNERLLYTFTCCPTDPPTRIFYDGAIIGPAAGNRSKNTVGIFKRKDCKDIKLQPGESVPTSAADTFNEITRKIESLPKDEIKKLLQFLNKKYRSNNTLPSPRKSSNFGKQKKEQVKHA